MMHTGNRGKAMMIIDSATIFGIIAFLGSALFLYETRVKHDEDQQ